MENINMYVINIQWGIFFGFILINMLIGFKRGFKKTSYYTIVSIGLTLLLMFGISFITINWFFKNPETLVKFVERFVDIPEDVRGIVINESVSPLLYVIIDIVLKIVVFVILYPIIKFILTITIFKPIYKRTIGKNDKIKRPNLGSRLGGSLVGSVKGVFLAVMILLPIIVIAGAFNQYNPTEGNISDTSNNNYVLLEDGTSNEGDLEEIEEIMEIIKLFHENGLGNALSKFKLRGKSIDRQIFDLMFTSRVEDNQGNKVSVKLSEELDSIGLIVQILVEKGYLEDDFDFNEINYDDHFKDLETMIQALGDSKMLNLAVPIAISVLYDEGYITDELGFDVLEKEHTRKAFEALRNFSFKDELNTISNTLKEVLLVGSVEELIELSKNPELIDELSSEQKTSVANILKELGNLQVLKGANIAIEYLLNDEGVLEEITWTNEPYEYLVNQLDFILNNEDFLNEELLSISTLVDNLLKLDFKYSNLLDEEGKFDPQTLLLPNAEALVTTALDGIGGLQLVVNGIPLGVDYFLYTSNNTNIQELADQLSEIAQNQDYESEIDNINEIYSIAITLGLSQYFSDEDVLAITDKILSSDDGFANIKTIINNIFEGSNAVNDVLTIAGEPILKTLIKDQDLLDVALQVVSDEDFKYGTEVVNIIGLIETLYSEENNLVNLRYAINNKEYDDLANVILGLDDEKYEIFKTNLSNLQTLKNAGNALVEFGLKTAINDQELLDVLLLAVTNDEFKVVSEITNVLDLVRAVYGDELTISKVQSALNNNEYDKLANAFFNLEEERYETFKSGLTSLQTLEFAGSALVEFGLNAAINDQGLLDALLLAVTNDEFKVAFEITSALDLVKSVYSDENNISSIQSAVNNKDYARLIGVIGKLEQTDFDNFKTNLLDLQILMFASKELAVYGASKVGNNILIVPNNANYDSIKYDLNKALDIAYESAQVVERENLTTQQLTTINIAQVIDLDEFKQLLSFDYDQDEAVLKNSILVNTIIDNIVRRDNINIGSIGTINLPAGYNTRAVTEDWINEINLLTEGLFDIVDEFSGEDEKFVLSINNLKGIKGLKDVPTHVVTRFKDDTVEDSPFSKLFSSEILSHNLHQVGLNQLDRYKIPNDLVSIHLENALKDGDSYIDLINILANVLHYVNEDGLESLDATFRSINLHNAFDILNNIEEEYVVRLANNAIVNNAFRDAVIHKYIQDQAYKFINGAKIPAPLNTVNSGIFDFKSSIDAEDRLKEDSLEKLLVLTRNLGLPANFLKTPGNQIVNILTDAFTEDRIDELVNIEFMHDITSNIFLLSELKVLMGNSAGFNPNDLTLNYTAKDSNDNIDKLEVTNLLLAVKSIGVGGFSNISITTIKDADMDVLLASNYLYEVLDLTIKAQLDEEDVPTEAIYQTGEHTGLIRKEEFDGLIETLNILDIDNPNDLNADNITIAQLDEVIEVDSFIIKKLISNQIKEIIDVPTASETNGIIIQTELENLVKSLLIINDDDYNAKLNSIDTENISITTTKFGEMLALNSNIIDRLISTEVIKTIDEDILSGLLINDDKDIVRIHLEGLHTGLVTLEIDEITGNINTDDFDIINLEEITRTDDTVIINRLISKSIEDAINDEDIIEGTKDGNFISREETNKFFNNLLDLGITTVDGNIDSNTLAVADLITVTEANNSVIVNRLIAESVFDGLNSDVPSSIVINGYIERLEVNKLFKALDALQINNITKLTDDTNFVDTVTFDEIILANNVESILFRIQLSKQMIASSLVTENAEVVMDGIQVIPQEELEKFFAAGKSLDPNITTITELIDYIETTDPITLGTKVGEMELDPDNMSTILVDTIKDQIGL